MENILDEAVERRRTTVATSYPPSPLQSGLPTESRVDVEFNIQVHDQEAIIEERKQRVFEIEKKAGELKGLADDVCGQVYATGEKIEGINENMDVAHENMVETNNELITTIKSQKKNNKCMWTIIIVSIVLVLVIIGIILIFVLTPASIATAEPKARILTERF